MNDDIEARLIEALNVAEQQEPGGNVVIFTASQAEALVQVAEWWMAMRGAGRIGGAIASGVKWLAFMIAAWIALKAGFLDWIAENLRGSQ